MSKDQTETIAKVYRNLATIAGNIAYIRGEMPSLDVPGELRAEITGLCDEFDETLYDVRKEVGVLEDALGMHPGEEPSDPNVLNPDPNATISLILEWLQQGNEHLNRAVMKLRGLDEREPKLQVVEILVGESGANILNAYVAIREELTSILSRLRERPRA